jgi:hypothetical protein
MPIKRCQKVSVLKNFGMTHFCTIWRVQQPPDDDTADLLASVPAVRTGDFVGYARVSTKRQLLDRQIRALTDAGCSRIFSDKKSGKNAEREELWKALDYLRPGDILVVPSLDRFGRSIQDLIAIVSGLRKRGIGPIQGRSPASTYADAKAWAASSTNTNMPLDPHARGFRQGQRRGQAGVTRVCRAGGVTPPARHVVQILTRDRC